jgi:hypothetical protein
LGEERDRNNGHENDQSNTTTNNLDQSKDGTKRDSNRPKEVIEKEKQHRIDRKEDYHKETNLDVLSKEHEKVHILLYVHFMIKRNLLFYFLLKKK